MPTPTLSAEDGDYTEILEAEGRYIEYPFLNAQIRDAATKVYRNPVECARSSYSPLAALTAHPDDANAYIVDQGKPVPIGGDLVRVDRAYANIPVDQVAIDSRLFSRPNLNGITYGGVYGVTVDAGETTHLIFSRIAVSLVAASSASTQSTVTPLPSTAIHFQDSGGHTCDLAANSSAATAVAVLTAALTSLSGFAAVVSTGYINLSWTGTMTLQTPPSGVTTVSAGAAFGNYAGSGTITSPGLTYIVAAGINAAVGDRACLWSGNTLAGTGTVVTVPDTDSISISTNDLSSSSTVITHVALAKNGLRLANGSKACRIRMTDAFYLPGKTTGITTPADIPSVPTYLDPIAWLGRILATTLTGVTATAATDRFNKTAHGLSTGDTFFVLVLGGATGITRLAQYWAIKVDADNWQAATSAENAKAGTAVNITADGSSMSVLVPAPYAAISVSQLSSWMGPILQRRTEEVQMADALEARDAAA